MRASYRKFAVFATAVIIGCVVLASWQRTEYVDLHSGRARHRSTLWSFVIFEDVRQTAFSQRFGSATGESVEWRKVQSHGALNSVSPHYTFHRAAYLLQAFVERCDLQKVSREEQRAASQELLRLLQNGELHDAETLVDKIGVPNSPPKHP